ncbi:MAG: DNA-binding transcriptional regulator NtrC [Sodalis sp.]|nr:MAG: DNA-binding transcriptional regulator NtrC [Sodalis sp.]
MLSVIITAHSDLDAIVSVCQREACDYLLKPFDIDEAVALVKRAVSHHLEQLPPRSQSASGPLLTSSAYQSSYQRRAGTGKESVANALHRHSPCAKASFIAINMAAILK